MPYFKWSGIHITGTIISGNNFARSAQALDVVLFTNEIALLSHKEYRWPTRALSYEQRAFFCKQVATLLKSGIRLYDALNMSHLALSNKNMRFFVQDCAAQVQQGIAFSTSLHAYRDFFGDFVIHMIYAGEESGNLGFALDSLGKTLAEYNTFNKRLRSALIMPCITFALFIILFCAIFFVVIPRFQSMIQGQHTVLPVATRIIFALSTGLRSFSFLCTVACLMSATFCITIALFFVNTLRPYKEKILFALPGVRYIINEYNRIQFLQALGVLLEGGVPLVKALYASADFIGINFLQQKYYNLATQVQNGALLADAFAYDPLLYTAELDAFIKTGFSSGTLGTMITQASLFYKEQFYQRISFCIALIQPVMLSVMGLLIAILIVALYMPLFSFSSVL